VTDRRPLALLACQLAVPPTPDPAARDAHLAATAERIAAQLAAKPADLVVLPELSGLDYSRSAFEALDRLAEPLDGPSYRTFSALARATGSVIVYGFPRRGDDGYRITQAVVAADGTLLGHYDKLHIAQFGASMERDYFIPGEALFLFEVGGLTVAPIICYDIRFPELCRALAAAGTELILHCGAYYRDESYYSWPHFAVTRAIENQVYLLSLNRAGPSYGGSLFCPPFVDAPEPELRFSVAQEFRHLSVEPAGLEQGAQVLPLAADRRGDYGALPLRRAIAG
jgi:nitrilase